MSDTDSDIPNLIDRSVKRLFRDQPQAVLRLAGVEAAAVRFEDSNLNIPELRADHVLIVEEEGEPTPYALYLEYQLKPDARLPASWGLKWLGLCHQLPMEVVLLVIYLEKGDRATFPAAYQRTAGRLQTTLSFDTVRLWEHRDRIVSGEWPELAPLLVLCEAHPTEQTLRQEVDLIHNSGLPHDVQMDLLGVAVLVASRTFARTLLRTIFREEFLMIDAMENLKELFLETGKLQMWLQDPRLSGEVRDAGRAEGLAEGRAEGRAEGKAEGEAAGRAEGEAEAVRRMTLALLTRRFGDVSEALQAQIATADADWCQDLFDRAITAASLSELTDNRS
jgi:predicted transposase YdaD